jgi:hypothetical protein
MKNPLNMLQFSSTPEPKNALMLPSLKSIFADTSNLKLFGFTLVISILTYWFELTNFTLSYDEELYTYDPSGSCLWWISQERWAMAGFFWAMPNGFGAMPFLPTAFLCICLSLSALVLAEAISVDSRWKFFFVALFVSCPVFIHIGEFSQHAPGVGIGLLLASIASRNMLLGFSKKHFIFSIIFVAVAIGFYQSLIFFFFTSSLLILIGERSKLTPFPRAIFSILPPVIVAIASLFLHNLIAGVVQKVFHIQRTDYLDAFIVFKDILPSFGRMFNRMLAILGGYSPLFLDSGTLSMIICWIGTFFIILSFLKKQKLPSLVKVIFFIASYLSAVIFIFLSPKTFLAYRALFALSSLYAFVGAYTGKLSSHKFFASSILFISVFTNIHISTTLFYTDQVTRMRDQVMATMLFSRMAEVEPKLGAKKIKFTVIGNYVHEKGNASANLDFVGLSFFADWNKHRTGNYFRLLGLKNLELSPLTSVFSTPEESNKYPSWPDKNSVFYKGDVLVIKLNEMNYDQIRQFQKK